MYLAGEPKNDDGGLLTFDWTVANEASALASNYTPARQLKIVTSLKAMSDKISEEQRMFIRRLQAKKFAEISYIDDDLVTGGNIEDEQVEVAPAIIACGIQDETPHRRSANHIHYWTTIRDRHDGPVSCAIASLGSAGNVNAGSLPSFCPS
ncbi:hypothetical protein [Pseudomonas sp. MWU12-2029]|uniref:hypothetical protein n=1 Tax=Pseudomonas sp. MWU12-2029 TaxID=2927805 RepID=UPI00200E69B2|nr:hypothetical protein [Pseudomonas sp. MWU12-2029]